MQKSTKEPRTCLEEFLAAQEGVGGRLCSAGALIQVLTSSRSTEGAGRIQGSRVIEPAPETALAGNVRRNRALWAPLGQPALPAPTSVPTSSADDEQRLSISSPIGETLGEAGIGSADVLCTQTRCAASTVESLRDGGGPRFQCHSSRLLGLQLRGPGTSEPCSPWPGRPQSPGGLKVDGQACVPRPPEGAAGSDEAWLSLTVRVSTQDRGAASGLGNDWVPLSGVGCRWV